MKTKLTTLILLAIASTTSFAQELSFGRMDANDLRRMVMQSHVIVAVNHYETINDFNNDYSITKYYLINQVDSMITNETKFNTSSRIKIKQRINDYAISWNDTTAYINMVDLVKVAHIDVYYSNLLFLRQEDKQYTLLGIIEDVEWSNVLRHYIPAIRQIQAINHIRDLHERYTQTMDWYIEQNEYPDRDFIAFYQHKAIIGETLTLSNAQIQRVKENILNGKEKLLPLVSDKFKTELKTFHLKELKKIRNLSHEKRDYYRFRAIVEMWYDFGWDINYMLIRKLLKEDKYGFDHEFIMDYFIEMFERDLDL